MIRAALVVLLGFLASGVLGMVRLSIINSIFGASAELDAFIAAQQIPEVLFVLVAGGALGSSFIPVFSRLSTADPERGWRLASATLTLVADDRRGIGSVYRVDCAICRCLTFWFQVAIQQSRNSQRLWFGSCWLTVMIFSVSGLIMGILNARQNFLFPSLSPQPEQHRHHHRGIGLRANDWVTSEESQRLWSGLGRGLGCIAASGDPTAWDCVIVKARLRWLFDWRVEGRGRSACC